MITQRTLIGTVDFYFNMSTPPDNYSLESMKSEELRKWAQF